MKMPKEMKTAWVEALRSGKYKQTRRQLEFMNSYCCLGVLECVLDGDVERHKQGQFIGASLSLPTPAWLSSHGIKLTNDDVILLAMMNDSGHSFSQIADFIEKGVEGV